MFKRSILWGALCAASASTALAQTAAPTIESLQASAKAYADVDWPGTYTRLCIPSVDDANLVLPTLNPADYPTAELPTPPGGDPPAPNWYSTPARIGDNLYFLGTRSHSTYALVSRGGKEIILIDGNYEYATVSEIHKGLKRVGLDINNVKYAIYSHAHSDHDGGAYLTEAAIPGATIIYGEGDWPSVMARTGPHATRHGPENDGTDGRIVTAGDVSVKIVTMPGHTPGTISFLFEYKDNGKPIRVAYPGGTAVSFTGTASYYDTYISSARKFAQAAASYGATALLSNHTEFDNAYFKAHTAQALRDGASLPQVVPNPYFVGPRAVVSYMGVVELCSMAAKLRATGSL